MKVLVAGGTRFIGRHLVDFLLSEGHEVWLFNRGKTNPGLYSQTRLIAGDRSAPPDELKQHDWDWVFDLSCYAPEDADSLVRTVGPRTGRYVFCSTISVYNWQGTPEPVVEDCERVTYTPDNIAESAPPALSYGAKKRGAEDIVLELAPVVGMQAAIVRPCLVYGPWDTSDRLHYWLHRVREGSVVVPRDGRGMVQAVYVKDLARIFLAAAKAMDAAGRMYNGASTYRLSLMDWIRTAAVLVGKQPRVVEASWEDLRAAGVQSLPGLVGETAWSVSADRLVRDFGFTSTPFADTVAESMVHMAREGRPIKEAIPMEALEKLLGGR
jgi:2'-hydroxyisoflavone reductase